MSQLKSHLQCTDSQCLSSKFNFVCEYVTRVTEKCLLSALTGVRIKQAAQNKRKYIHELFVGTNETGHNKQFSVLSGCL